jgi:outer membrane lipoprotein-sorting protein
MAAFAMCREMRALKQIVCLSILSVMAVSGQAQLGHEIAQKHAARAGDKLAALTALRAEGRTFINEEVVPFTLVAQRPNRLRVESFTPRRRVVQVYNGTDQPWISHSELKGGAPQGMTEDDAREFIANADFDGPLVNFAAKGYSVDYAGEEKIEGRAAYKLLLMNKRDDIFFLWVDAENYEIVKRTAYRMFSNQRVAVDTLFKDFREVGGVLQPYRIETTANGRTLYIMLIDRMEANPAVPPATFARPPAPP